MKFVRDVSLDVWRLIPRVTECVKDDSFTICPLVLRVSLDCFLQGGKKDFHLLRICRISMLEIDFLTRSIPLRESPCKVFQTLLGIIPASVVRKIKNDWLSLDLLLKDVPFGEKKMYRSGFGNPFGIYDRIKEKKLLHHRILM